MRSHAFTLGRRIRNGVSTVDVVLLGVVPVILLGVYTLPVATREGLVFRYAAPSVRTAFTAPFVHFESTHLLFNLAGYGLIVGMIYASSAASGHRAEFRVVFTTLLLAGPPLLTYLNLTIVRLGVTFGFSGVLMAYYGYLPLSIAEHLESKLELGRSETVAPLLFFLGLTFMTSQILRAVLHNPVTVAVDGVPTSVTWVLAVTLAELLVLLALVIVLYSISVADEHESIRARLGNALRQTGHFELAVFTIVLFLTVPFATFPTEPIVGERVFNLYVHFVGYALGFIASYLYHVL